MSRSPDEVPVWDLTPLYRSLDDPNLDAHIEAVVPTARAFRDEWKGKISGAGVAEVLRAVVAYEDVSKRPRGPYAYAQLLFSANSGEPAHVALVQRIKEAATRAQTDTVFFSLELDEIPDDSFRHLIDSPDLEPYRHFLGHSRDFRPHRLSEPEEVVLGLKDLTGRSAFVQLYSQLTSSFRFPFELDGESKELTGSELLALLKHPDRTVRRRAYETYAERYERETIAITSVWNALVTDHRQNLELRGYPEPMAPTHLRNEVSATAVETLMGVTRSHYGLAQRYYQWKAKVLGVDRLWSTDLVAPLPGAEPGHLPFATAQRWVLDAFAGFHSDFADIASGFFEEQRIDAPPKPGKSGGAFCMGVDPELPVYVLMNYTGKLRDAATLAHELGHGIHFTLARGQPLLEYSPVLPMAETASVFGELLLTRQLMATDLQPAVRRNLLAERVEDIIATTFRQNMYTEFERRAHQEGGREYLSTARLCDLWSENLGEAYGRSVENLPASQWAWAAIPHFVHTRFYCYAYVFGELLVLALYQRYLEEGPDFAPKMIRLLEAGGSQASGELVNVLGYDLEDPDFWTGGYCVLEEMIAELEST
jgi:oligoendopeptidase F